MDWIMIVGWTGLAAVCALLLWAAVRDGNPARRLASTCIQGIGGVLLVNLTAGLSGVSLGFGWTVLGGCALLGLPGVITAVILRLLFGVAA